MSSEREIVKRLFESKDVDVNVNDEELEEASFEANGKHYSSAFGKYSCDGEAISREDYFKAKDGGSVGGSGSSSGNSYSKAAQDFVGKSKMSTYTDGRPGAADAESAKAKRYQSALNIMKDNNLSSDKDVDNYIDNVMNSVKDYYKENPKASDKVSDLPDDLQKSYRQMHDLVCLSKPKEASTKQSMAGYSHGIKNASPYKLANIKKSTKEPKASADKAPAPKKPAATGVQTSKDGSLKVKSGNNTFVAKPESDGSYGLYVMHKPLRGPAVPMKATISGKDSHLYKSKEDVMDVMNSIDKGEVKSWSSKS